MSSRGSNSIKNKSHRSPRPSGQKARISQILRTQVWDTWVGLDVGQITCPYCKVHRISQLDFECGHLRSEANGGATNVKNLRPVCQKCNKSYGRKDMPDKYKKWWRCCF